MERLILGLKIAELVTQPVMDFAREVVMPDEVKEREKPRPKPDPLADVLKIVQIRRELRTMENQNLQTGRVESFANEPTYFKSIL